jgi:hypothetical protein
LTTKPPSDPRRVSRKPLAPRARACRSRASPAKLEEVEQAAPREIDDDVDTLLAGQRERAGLPSSAKVDEAKASAAEERIRAWERRNCEA